MAVRPVRDEYNLPPPHRTLSPFFRLLNGNHWRGHDQPPTDDLSASSAAKYSRQRLLTVDAERLRASASKARLRAVSNRSAGVFVVFMTLFIAAVVPQV